jgi:hypothetical protein
MDGRRLERYRKQKSSDCISQSTSVVTFTEDTVKCHEGASVHLLRNEQNQEE